LAISADVLVSEEFEKENKDFLTSIFAPVLCQPIFINFFKKAQTGGPT
jgi:hypothetical protein